MPDTLQCGRQRLLFGIQLFSISDPNWTAAVRHRSADSLSQREVTQMCAHYPPAAPGTDCSRTRDANAMPAIIVLIGSTWQHSKGVEKYR